MKQRLRTGLILGSCVLIAVLSLLLAYSVTQERIAETRHQWFSESLHALLPDGPFDNDPLNSARWLSGDGLGSAGPVPIYPVFKNEMPYAAVLSVATNSGYNGNITLLLGVRYDGEIIGARVTHHRETPGLGDDIELRHSDWITRFNGYSLATTTSGDWTVKKSGGQFDAFTGATITPRAVIHAIHDALEWYATNRHLIYAT